MSWKQSLDKYLTTPTNECFSDYCESVTEEFSNLFFEENESWILNDTKKIDEWLERLLYKDTEPKRAANIIERAFKLYIKN